MIIELMDRDKINLIIDLYNIDKINMIMNYIIQIK